MTARESFCSRQDSTVASAFSSRCRGLHTFERLHEACSVFSRVNELLGRLRQVQSVPQMANSGLLVDLNIPFGCAITVPVPMSAIGLPITTSI